MDSLENKKTTICFIYYFYYFNCIYIHAIKNNKYIYILINFLVTLSQAGHQGRENLKREKGRNKVGLRKFGGAFS